MSHTSKKNAAFKKLTKSQKRVAIAKDVLKYLKNGKLQAMNGTYIEAAVPGDNVTTCELFKKAETCTVCALGAIFVAGTLRDCTIVKEDTLFTSLNESHNDYYTNEMVPATTEASPDPDEMRTSLSKYFSEKQLETIENAFEHTDANGEGKGRTFFSYDEVDDFSSDEKLRKIMKNIIANDGTFKP